MTTREFKPALNPEIAKLRLLPTNKEFLLGKSSLPRRLCSEKPIERIKGFSKIEIFHGGVWIPGYITHQTLLRAQPLKFIGK